MIASCLVVWNYEFSRHFFSFSCFAVWEFCPPAKVLSAPVQLVVKGRFLLELKQLKLLNRSNEEYVFLDVSDVNSWRSHWNSFTGKRWKAISSPRQPVKMCRYKFPSFVACLLSVYFSISLQQGLPGQLCRIKCKACALIALQFCISKASKETQ